MKILADENVPAPLVEALRNAGEDVDYIVELSPGITDDEVLDIAREQGRILLTEDKDFGELVFRLKRGLLGVILVRLPEDNWESHWSRLMSVIERYKDMLTGNFTVIEEKKIRFRRLHEE